MKPTIYQLRVKGHLDAVWAAHFAPLALLNEPGSDEATLTGPVRDQAELYGLLMKARDLGLTLLAVSQVEPGARGRPSTNLDR